MTSPETPAQLVPITERDNGASACTHPNHGQSPYGLAPNPGGSFGRCLCADIADKA